jgi:hypothetical protein
MKIIVNDRNGRRKNSTRLSLTTILIRLQSIWDSSEAWWIIEICACVSICY